MLCNVMLRRVPCYGCAFCASLQRTKTKNNLMTARVSMLLKSRSSLKCFRACFLPGRAKDISAPLYPCLMINLKGRNMQHFMKMQLFFGNKNGFVKWNYLYYMFKKQMLPCLKLLLLSTVFHLDTEDITQPSAFLYAFTYQSEAVMSCFITYSMYPLILPSICLP